MNTTNSVLENRYALREEIHRLAEEAFHQHLISGYGDGEYPDQFQIVWHGKPKHFPLQQAYTFLMNSMERSPH